MLRDSSNLVNTVNENRLINARGGHSTHQASASCKERVFSRVARLLGEVKVKVVPLEGELTEAVWALNHAILA